MRNVIPFLAVVLLFVSCTNKVEVGTPFGEGQEVTLTASIVDGNSGAKQVPGKQRVSGKDVGVAIDLTWNAGDQILVSVGDKSAVFTLSSGENSSSGEFTGKMPADGSEYSVSYPVDYSDNVLTHQTYVANGFGNGLMKMSTKRAGTIEGGFKLSADNAVLGLQLTGNQTLGKIVLTDLASGVTYTLNCEGVVLKGEVTLFYIVVPVVGWEAGMRVEVLDQNERIILTKEKTGKIAFDAKEAMVMPSLEARGPGKRIGVFSVGEGKYVSFSQGNLQYIQSTKTWQFAKEQYEYIGEKHYRNGQLADTIEYFGWSGKNSKTPWGISLSDESSDYAGEFLDWGTNSIAGSAPNTWRTLSNDEWLYICQGRKNADQLLGLGTIGTVTGLVILPDDWQLPAGLSFIPNTDNATKNQYTYEQWDKMENAGAVFFATCGYFNHKSGGMRHIGEEGHIRTNALSDRGLQIYTAVKTDKIIYSCSGTQEQNLHYAFAQRLVHDTIVPEAVDLGLSVKWATFNVGATSPEDYGDYFAWGETEPKKTYSWTTYKWGTSSKLTKYNTTDGKTILDPEDDAAYVNWGDKWRMPTKNEMQELFDRCTWKTETQNGINGYNVIGPNGNSIFVPMAGWYNADLFGEGVQGNSTYYWTSTLSPSKEIYAYDLVFNDVSGLDDGIRANTRRCGFPIRPVYDDRVK